MTSASRMRRADGGVTPMSRSLALVAWCLRSSCCFAGVGDVLEPSTSIERVPPLDGHGTAVLKVCTTGDYPPFSSYDPETGQYTGLAPTIMRNFAAAISYSVEFVRTTWVDLSVDLDSGTTCLIAADGITLTPDREALFAVSSPLLTDKKVAVFSKANEHIFTNLETIDQPNVSVVENEGGTNVEFVDLLREHGLLQSPRIEILSSTAEVYACLEQYPKLELVMFTDSLEVQYRTSQRDTVLSARGADIEIPACLNPETSKVFLAHNSTEGHVVIAELDRFLTGARATGVFEAWRRVAFNTTYRAPAANCSLDVGFV